MTSRRRTWIRSALGAGLTLVVAASCASASPPGDDVPELRTTLAAVDSAIADREYGQARNQLAKLVRTTIAARDTGELAPDEAEPILAAAATLVSALPEPRPRAGQPEPYDDKDDDKGHDKDEREKWREELEKKREEQEKKREEERKKDDDEKDGNGHSSDNGPDDGHGD